MVRVVVTRLAADPADCTLDRCGLGRGQWENPELVTEWGTALVGSACEKWLSMFDVDHERAIADVREIAWVEVYNHSQQLVATSA